MMGGSDRDGERQKEKNTDNERRCTCVTIARTRNARLYQETEDG